MTLKAVINLVNAMEVTVRVVGGNTHELDLSNPTYADVIRAIGLHPQEATALVDGRPVPDDRAVDRSDVQVLRLITGG